MYSDASGIFKNRWGFRVCTLHNLLYSPGAGADLPESADSCRHVQYRTVAGRRCCTDGGGVNAGALWRLGAGGDAVPGCALACSDVV